MPGIVSGESNTKEHSRQKIVKDLQKADNTDNMKSRVLKEISEHQSKTKS